MNDKRVQLILMALLAIFLLGACNQIEDVSESADVSTIENAQFYNDLLQTVVRVQIPVIFIGLVNLIGGWKLKRFGLVINGFLIGGLMVFTALDNADLIQDENVILGIGVVGGLLIGILAFFLYNLMALIIGGAIGTTLMGGAWLQAAESVPPIKITGICTRTTVCSKSL